MKIIRCGFILKSNNEETTWKSFEQIKEFFAQHSPIFENEDILIVCKKGDFEDLHIYKKVKK